MKLPTSHERGSLVFHSSGTLAGRWVMRAWQWDLARHRLRLGSVSGRSSIHLSCSSQIALSKSGSSRAGYLMSMCAATMFISMKSTKLP